jgi:hypothetical protein
VLFDAEYVRESILRPRAKLAAGFEPLMPTYEGQVTEEDILAITAFLKTLTITPDIIVIHLCPKTHIHVCFEQLGIQRLQMHI